MQCKSCKEDVPSKFSHAILTNQCPLCGDAIMDEELQESLKLLKNAMSAVKDYPKEIFDWLKSNYNLYSQEDLNEKVASVKVAPQPRSVRQAHSEKESADVDLDSNGNQTTGVPLQDSSQTDKFFNSPTNTVTRNDYLKDLVNQIRTNGSPVLLGEDGTEGVITPEMAGNLSKSSSGLAAGLNAAFGNTDEDEDSGSDDEYYDSDEEIPDFVLNMSKGKNNSSQTLAKVQQVHQKSLNNSKKMSKTGGVGLIRR